MKTILQRPSVIAFHSPTEVLIDRSQVRICPSPLTTHLYDMISRIPMGPRACSLLVEIATSAPNPNSPPSLNRVDVLAKTAAASTSFKNRSMTSASSAITASEWPEP